MWGRLVASGVLGLNQRNASFIGKYNRRKLYPLVDDKILTKRLALESGIAVPELYGVVEIQHQMRDLEKMLQPYDDFVVKPAHGSGGEGVLIISGRVKNAYRTINGLPLSHDELQHHVSNIMGGMYSLGARSDKVLIEYRVQFDSIFEKITYLGVPDIRIIVFLGVPVMAMARLPTRLSQGKANLHRGAIGVGVDLARGVTTSGAWGSEIITEHPDTGHPIADIQIPNWTSLLTLASRCYEITSLGYVGVDIVLDREKGPLILEMNARPGLAIQIANGKGLIHRLKWVEENRDALNTPDSRVKASLGPLSVV